MFALVDGDDLERVASRKWYAVPSGGRTFYVRATSLATLPAHHANLHAFILRVHPGQRVDHENGNGLDCRKANLRPATATENAQNSFKAAGNFTSKFKGVRLTSSGRWAASITVDGEPMVLGLFDGEVDAALAYDEAATKHFGAFAKTNAMMGLFEVDVALRDKLGANIQDVRKVGEFQHREKGDSRSNFGAVIGLARHQRKAGVLLYKLSTGRHVPAADFLGTHPSSEEMERMKDELKAKESLRKADRQAAS
ncbi:AP2/ERF family transcription factor [Ensifer canadensis]